MYIIRDTCKLCNGPILTEIGDRSRNVYSCNCYTLITRDDILYPKQQDYEESYVPTLDPEMMEHLVSQLLSRIKITVNETKENFDEEESKEEVPGNDTDNYDSGEKTKV